MWSERGFTNAPKFHNYTEKLRLFVCTLIQPFERGTMLVSELPRQPNYHVGVIPCGVGQQLAQVGVIGSLKLVFDDYCAVIVQVGCQHIQRVNSNRRLRPLQLQDHAQGFAQLGDILGQPRREIQGLVGPGFAEVYTFDLGKV